MTGLVLVVLWFLQQGQWSPQLVSKSLVRKSQRKEKTTSVKVESVKIEASTCPRCFCKTFKGQIECDFCGLMLDAPKANRTKIAERRKEELRKLGLYHDFEGECLQQITFSQLDALGILDDQARGSASPEADLLKIAKSRFEGAVSLGFKSVLDRFSKDATFAESLLNEGDNEYDCECYDLLHCDHLPKPDRTRAQVRLGTSEVSQLEHNARRLVYLDIASEQDAPDRFLYL